MTKRKTETQQAPHDDIVRDNYLETLPVRLSEDEFTRVARAKAKAEDALEEIEREADEKKAEYKRRIEEAEAEIDRMRLELSSEERKQPVQCFDRYVQATHMIERVRKDTGAVFDTRVAKLSELQRVLPGAESLVEADVIDDDELVLLDEAEHRQNQASAAAQAMADIHVEETDDGDATVPDAPATTPKRNRNRKRK